MQIKIILDNSGKSLGTYKSKKEAKEEKII